MNNRCVFAQIIAIRPFSAAAQAAEQPSGEAKSVGQGWGHTRILDILRSKVRRSCCALHLLLDSTALDAGIGLWCRADCALPRLCLVIPAVLDCPCVRRAAGPR